MIQPEDYQPGAPRKFSKIFTTPHFGVHRLLTAQVGSAEGTMGAEMQPAHRSQPRSPSLWTPSPGLAQLLAMDLRLPVGQPGAVRGAPSPAPGRSLPPLSSPHGRRT